VTREQGDLPRHITSPGGWPVGRTFAAMDESPLRDGRAAGCCLAIQWLRLPL
jgi:hypothetical protein